MPAIAGWQSVYMILAGSVKPAMAVILAGSDLNNFIGILLISISYRFLISVSSAEYTGPEAVLEVLALRQVEVGCRPAVVVCPFPVVEAVWNLVLLVVIS